MLSLVSNIVESRNISERDIPKFKIPAPVVVERKDSPIINRLEITPKMHDWIKDSNLNL